MENNIYILFIIWTCLFSFFTLVLMIILFIKFATINRFLLTHGDSIKATQLTYNFIHSKLKRIDNFNSIMINHFKNVETNVSQILNTHDIKITKNYLDEFIGKPNKQKAE